MKEKIHLLGFCETCCVSIDGVVLDEKVCMDSWLLICCFQLGFLAQLTSTLILLWRVVTDPQGLQGISMKSQTMLLVASVVRVFWVMDTEFGDHHFPFIELIASILAYSGFIGYVQYQKHKGENTIYDKQNETFPVRYIYGGCAIPAVLIFFEYDQVRICATAAQL